MTTDVAHRARMLVAPGPDRTRTVVLVALAVVVMGRLPFVARPSAPDEAGFLLVGRQWGEGGSSLYGNYWVDRPPLLVTVFRWAAQMGGLVPLRLIGCVAAALVVLGAADVARRVGGGRAARWAAICAAALLLTPLVGGREVDGELLAAPLVLGGMSAALAAVSTPDQWRGLRAAALTGILAVAAVLVKQNIADVGVFAAVLALVLWRRHEVSAAAVRRFVLASALGAAAALMVVGAWTMLHGTSLTGVYDAMYPFRIAAGDVMATSGGQHATVRSFVLLGAWVGSGLAVISVMTVWALASRHLRGAAEWAVLATIAFDAVSVVLGGNSWLHYLVQCVGPVSVAAGVLVARRQRGAPAAVGAVAAVAAIAWTVGLVLPTAPAGIVVGEAIARSAIPGDTIVSAYGHPDVVRASGLSSPYPYLWSLPVKTLDPQLRHLDQTLAGPAAPSWLVVWNHVSSWGLDSAATRTTIARDYRVVARPCGRTVYLHDGLDRAAVRAVDCTTGTHEASAAETIKEHTP